MKLSLLPFAVLLAVAGRAVADDAAGSVLFSDAFQAKQLSSEWQVVEGEWGIEGGALTNRDGGLIVLNVPPGGRFAMDFEIQFPSNWMSVIPFYTAPEDYGTLYFGGQYWESFEMVGKEIANYRQRRDPEIDTANGYHRIKVVSEYGLVSFTFDGKAKGPAAIAFRPGARVAFRSLPDSGLLRIKDFRLEQLGKDNAKTVYRLPADRTSNGAVYQDYRGEGKPGAEDRLAVDPRTGETELTYAFEPGAVFESCFVRLSVDAAKSNAIRMDVAGDGSKNDFFVVVHDASGEQHLVMATGLAWLGWQDIGVNLTTFLESPERNERLIIHWGGDNNQKIDFPVKSMDIGVAKRGSRAADRGQVRFRNVRFVESR